MPEILANEGVVVPLADALNALKEFGGEAGSLFDAGLEVASEDVQFRFSVGRGLYRFNVGEGSVCLQRVIDSEGGIERGVFTFSRRDYSARIYRSRPDTRGFTSFIFVFIGGETRYEIGFLAMGTREAANAYLNREGGK